MEWGSMPVTPFSHFVTPELSPSPKRFPRFMDLPLELHRLIFQACDTPTLFHLMHTSSYIRSECSELFWGSGNRVWYRPDHAYYLFNEKDSPIDFCSEFASRITHVEISLYFADHRRMAYTGRTFWDRLQGLFPSARNVVLSGSQPRRKDISQYFFISQMVGPAPPDINAFVAFKCKGDVDVDEHALRHRLWRVERHRWSLVQDIWTPMRVLLPPKRVPPGLLNDLSTSDRIHRILWREMKALNWLKLETYARYSDTSVIECPDPGCKDLEFHTLKDFKIHILVKRHIGGSSFTHDNDLVLYHRYTPVEVKAVLDSKQRRLDEMVRVKRLLEDDLHDRYRRPGDAKRKFEEELTVQMKEHGYLAPHKSLEDSNLWLDRAEIFEFDYPEHPEEKDFDPDCAEEENWDQ
jgi:hypothetical protein